MLTDTEFEVLATARNRLQAAQRGQKDAIVDQAARLLGCSRQTAYRKLKLAGHDTGRKRRSDAGDSMLTLEQLRMVAGVLAASMNQKGQRMPLGLALDMLRANGKLDCDASESTVARQLYAHMLHPEQLALPSESVQLTSLHPNHVWQVDSTTGAYYYLPQGRLRWMDEAEFNKNKAHNLVKASSDLLTRYAATDHTTHCFKVRYFLGGESTQNLIEFLVWALWKQEAGPMHGVPLILMGDRGPANQSHLMGLFCKRLGIELLLHAPGNARATGSVEKSHDLARMHLETRYRFQDPREVTLDRLNIDAEVWAAAYCSTRVHSRHGRTRYAAWMEINRYPGALRVAASLDALREAAVGRPETPRVGNEKRISFRGLPYHLGMVPGVIAGMRVTVQSNVFRAPDIDVEVVDQDSGETTWHVVSPEQKNEWGYDAARVIGQGYKGVTNSALDDNRNLLKQGAYKVGDGLPTIKEAERARKMHAQAYGGAIDPMADVRATQVPAFLPRRSVPLGLPERPAPVRVLNHVEACKLLRERMGAVYPPQMFAHVCEHYPDGVPEAELDALQALFTTGQPMPGATDNTFTGLRAVGDGQ